MSADAQDAGAIALRDRARDRRLVALEGWHFTGPSIVADVKRQIAWLEAEGPERINLRRRLLSKAAASVVGPPNDPEPVDIYARAEEFLHFVDEGT